MFTANTMSSSVEALGMALPGIENTKNLAFFFFLLMLARWYDTMMYVL